MKDLRKSYLLIKIFFDEISMKIWFNNFFSIKSLINF